VLAVAVEHQPLDIYAEVRSCRVTLHGRRTMHPRGDRLPARHCHSPDTCRKLLIAGREKGMPFLMHDTLTLILAHDETLLFGDVIKGVGTWVYSYRITSAEAGLLKAAFRARANLYAARALVRMHPLPERAAQIALLVADAMLDDLMETRNRCARKPSTN
jgi:hypothetical protein